MLGCNVRATDYVGGGVSGLLNTGGIRATEHGGGRGGGRATEQGGGGVGLLIAWGSKFEKKYNKSSQGF